METIGWWVGCTVLGGYLEGGLMAIGFEQVLDIEAGEIEFRRVGGEEVEDYY